MKAGLRVRVLEGQTIDGRTLYEFPASPSQPNELVVVGRDPDHCQIAFVDDLRHHGLGNEHLAFRRSLARYQLDLNTQNTVLVDGKSTFEDKELRGTHVLQLGDAVKLEVTVIDDRSATIGGKQGDQVPEVAFRNHRLLAGLAVTVAVLAVGGWWGMWQQAKQNRLAAEAVAETRVALASLANIAPISDDVISRVRESIYAVILRNKEGNETIIGTGWAAPGKKVVTNIHVIDFESDPDVKKVIEEGGGYWVRSAVPPYRTHRVRNVTSHPGWARFREVTRGVVPLRKSLGGFRRVDFDDACDVATLEVEDADDLAAPLEIASPEELQNLRAGQPIAMVGYPEEGMISNPVNRPEPVSQKAGIVRLTDFFMEHRADSNNLLVQHSLPVTGGASGSPVVNKNGRVIAVVTAINPVSIPVFKNEPGSDAAEPKRTQRIMNPAAINFAQRADLVQDLLQGDGDAATVRYEADWTESLARLDRLSEQVIPLQRQELSEAFGREMEPGLLREFTGRATRPTSDSSPDDLPSMDIELPRGLISIVAVPTGNVDVDFALLDGSRVISETVDDALTFHGNIRFANRFARTLRLLAVTPADHPEPVEYRAQVINWRIDPDEYLAHVALDMAQSTLRTQSPPSRSFELPPVRLDSIIELDGETLVSGTVSLSLPAAALCAITCRPSRATKLAILAADETVLQMLGSPAESPCVLIPCLAAGEPVKLLVIAPGMSPKEKAVMVAVHVDAWMSEEGDR